MTTSLRLDRLSALVSRFQLDVSPTIREKANLVVCQSQGASAPDRIVFVPGGNLNAGLCQGAELVFLARVDWGGSQNPLMTALPEHMDISIEADPETQSLVTLLVSEKNGSRCGSGSVVNRLGEVLLVRLLRMQLSAGITDVGLLGGLADERLSPAIVAMHEHPGRLWSVDMLATTAGLSTSRFANRFTRTVGQTPMTYLRHWRMVLAHQDLQHGDRVQAVADRYGYASSEALARAFRRQFGHSPSSLRH